MVYVRIVVSTMTYDLMLQASSIKLSNEKSLEDS